MSNLELRSLLEQEIDILTQLNTLSLSKKEALLKDDLDLLSEIVLTEEKLSQFFQQVDNACSPQVQFFLNEGFDQVHFPEDIKSLLLNVRTLAQRLRTNNQFNQELIEDALGLIKFTINSITTLPQADSATYSSSGKINKHQFHSRVLDYKG